MRKAPKVMPSTAPSPSPRSAGGGTHTRGRQHGDTVPKPPYGSSQPQTHCWVASRRPSRSPPKPSRRWCCSAHGEGWGELGDSPAPPPPPRCHHPTGTGLGTPIPRGSVAPGRCPQLGAGDGWLGTPAGTRGRGCHTDLQPGLALEGGGEGDVAALGDGVGEAESPNLPGPAAGGLLQHGHAGALRLVGLHQQQRLPPRCHQPALLQLQVGRVVVPAHGGLRGWGTRGHREGCHPPRHAPRGARALRYLHESLLVDLQLRLRHLEGSGGEEAQEELPWDLALEGHLGTGTGTA